MTDIVVEPSIWGFSAFLPNGMPIAHSKSKELLDEYLAECVSLNTSSRAEPGVAGGVLASGHDVPGAGALGGSEARASQGAPAAGAPLTKISYTTRSRKTGATLSSGRTADGWGVLCASHGSLAPAPSGTEAEKMLQRVDEWCDGCAPIARGEESKIKKDALLEELL